MELVEQVWFAMFRAGIVVLVLMLLGVVAPPWDE